MCAPLGGFEWALADALTWDRVKRLLLSFLFGVENVVHSRVGFGTGLLIGDRGETCTLAVVVRVRRLVAIGSSS